MVVCADTSFLFSLYGNDVHTPRVVRWLSAMKRPILITSFNEFELGNALRFAEFRKVIPPGASSLCQSQFDTDRRAGRLQLQLCNLADVLEEAKRLSALYSLKQGHRSFDILHVAAALQMQAGQFLTFDENQKKLAIEVGLKVPL